MKHLLIIPLATLLIGYSASSCSSSGSDKARNDSIVAAELAAARLDSIRQDSINRRNFITPDLAFHDLHGDVKKLVLDNNERQIYTFDENGKWTNEPQWSEDDKKYSPDRTKLPKVVRNSEGYIACIYLEYDADDEYENIIWEEGKVKSRSFSTFSYDNDFVVTEDESSLDCHYNNTYCNYEVDGMGNWVKRDKVSKRTEDDSSYEVCYNMTTETRNITYHKSNGEGRSRIPNNAKQEQALQVFKTYNQKKEQESERQQRQREELERINQRRELERYHNGGSYGFERSTSFRSPSDVLSYLSRKTFKDPSNQLRVRIDRESFYFNGTAVSAAPRISNITSSTATIRAQSPYYGGQDLVFYLNSSNGTLTLQSGEKLYLSR